MITLVGMSPGAVAHHDLCARASPSAQPAVPPSGFRPCGVGDKGAVKYTWRMEKQFLSHYGYSGDYRWMWFTLLALTGFILTAGVACRRSAPAETESSSNSVKEPVREEPRLQFPEDLNAKDPSVNDFVTHAMLTATSGDYDAFRLLWSAREEPMAREEFLQGWDAVRQVRVRALEKIVIAQENATENSPQADMYAVFVEVSLDPEHRAAKDKPQREAILVMVREQNRWALLRAPKEVRNWLRSHVEGKSGNEHLEEKPAEVAPNP